MGLPYMPTLTPQTTPGLIGICGSPMEHLGIGIHSQLEPFDLHRGPTTPGVTFGIRSRGRPDRSRPVGGARTARMGSGVMWISGEP